MKIPLDRCVPKGFGAFLTEHDAVHASEVTWGSVGNGELVRRASLAGFDAIGTVDKNMPHQTSVGGAGIGVLVIGVLNNRLDSPTSRLRDVEEALASVSPGKYIMIGASGTRRPIVGVTTRSNAITLALRRP